MKVNVARFHFSFDNTGLYYDASEDTRGLICADMIGKNSNYTKATRILTREGVTYDRLSFTKTA